MRNPLVPRDFQLMQPGLPDPSFRFTLSRNGADLVSIQRFL